MVPSIYLLKEISELLWIRDCQLSHIPPLSEWEHFCHYCDPVVTSCKMNVCGIDNLSYVFTSSNLKEAHLDKIQRLPCIITCLLHYKLCLDSTVFWASLPWRSKFIFYAEREFRYLFYDQEGTRRGYYDRH